MIVRLLPLDGGDPIVLDRDLTLVGRADDCDVVLPHKSVSKQHCVLAVTDGAVALRDLGSTNGTRVNGQRVRRGILLPNDSLSVANFHYRVQCLPDAVARGAGPFLGRTLPDVDPEELEAVAVAGPPVRVNDLPDRYGP